MQMTVRSDPQYPAVNLTDLAQAIENFPQFITQASRVRRDLPDKNSKGEIK